MSVLEDIDGEKNQESKISKMEYYPKRKHRRCRGFQSVKRYRLGKTRMQMKRKVKCGRGVTAAVADTVVICTHQLLTIAIR